MMVRPHPDQHYGCFTFAQHGEDIIFLNIFKLLGIDAGGYLDLGAHHPETISNTKLLYDRGWRGVNVDANPYVIKEFERQRPADTTVNAAVALKAGEVELYLYSRQSGRNTIDPAEVERMRHWASPRETQRVPSLTINNIVQLYCKGHFPDLLSMDIEGMDYDVLQSARFEEFGFPKVVCVETRFQDTVRMQGMMVDKGYSLYMRAGENLIFVLREYWTRIFGV